MVFNWECCSACRRLSHSAIFRIPECPSLKPGHEVSKDSAPTIMAAMTWVRRPCAWPSRMATGDSEASYQHDRALFVANMWQIMMFFSPEDRSGLLSLRLALDRGFMDPWRKVRPRKAFTKLKTIGKALGRHVAKLLRPFLPVCAPTSAFFMSVSAIR